MSNFNPEPNGESKLDPKVKAAWVAALTSGKYRKAKWELRRTGLNGHHSYCCLGVLCNLGAKKAWGEDGQYDGKVCTLPEKIRRKVRLSPQDQGTLMELNDDHGWSLKQIGRWIDENL